MQHTKIDKNNDSGTLKEVEVRRVLVNPRQPRRHFSPEDLQDLADSIKSVGLIHPPSVRYLSEIDAYELISGERRLRASEMAGLKKIPVIIQGADVRRSAEAALVENIQRVDLNPLEVAEASRDLSKEFHMNQDELAKRVGKKRSTVANYMRLMSLSPSIQHSVKRGVVSMGHAKVILSLETEEQRELLHEMILRDELTVRQAEEAARRISSRSKKQKLVYRTRDFYLEQLEERLKESLGTKVLIQGKGKRGKIVIDYYSLDDLDRLLERFGATSTI